MAGTERFMLSVVEADASRTVTRRRDSTQVNRPVSCGIRWISGTPSKDVLASFCIGRYQVSLVELTNESFHLRLVDPRISRDILPSDRLLVGIHLANSEVGFRAVTVDAVVWRLVCSNGLVRRVAGKSLLRQRHIHVADARFLPLLEEAIGQATLVAVGFIEQMALSVKTPVPDPEMAIAYLGQMWGLTKQTQEFVRLALLGEPKTGQQDTLYGLVNAVTNAAQRLPVDDRFQLETLASVLIDTSATGKAEHDLRQRILSGAK
jgi:hypothetical protein